MTTYYFNAETLAYIKGKVKADSKEEAKRKVDMESMICYQLNLVECAAMLKSRKEKIKGDK